MEFEIEGLDKTIDVLYAMTVGIQPLAEKMVGDLADKAAVGMRSRVPTWRNELKNSITAKTARSGTTVIGEAKTGVPWAAPIEVGTGPQGPRGQRYFPPVENVRAWAEAKGLDARDVAYNIYIKGTKPHYFAAETAKELIQNDVVKAVGEFFREFEKKK